MNKRGPIPVANIVADLLSRNGLGQPQAVGEIEKIWREVVGDELASMTRCGKIQYKKITVIVTNSMVMQELTFRKQEILEAFNRKMKNDLIQDIRFRVGGSSQR